MRRWTCPTVTSLLALLLSNPACRNEPVEWTAQAGSTEFRSYNDPSGASLLLPEGWQARRDAQTGRLEAGDGESAAVVIWPVYSERRLDASEVKGLTSALLRQLHPQSRWQSPQQAAAGLFRTSGRSQDGLRQAALAAWQAGQKGTLLTLYTVSAPQGRFERLAGDFVEILNSFRPPQGNPREERTNEPPQPSFVRWNDPTEGAFSTEVPAEWKVQGGVVRPNPILAQAKLEAWSPDGAVYAYLGDAFPWFIEPNGFVSAGQVYTDPMGGRWPVAPYAPGAEFLSRHLLPQRLGDFEVVSSQPRPELAQALSRLTQSRCDAAQLSYRFQLQGRSYAGTAVCITQAFYSGGFSSWKVLRLGLAEAPQERVGEASAALARMSAGLRLNPQWLNREAAKAGVNSRIISEMNEVLGRQISESFRRQWQSGNAVAKRDAKARRGIEEVYDPLTDTRFEVESGSRHYWIDPQGRIAGTLTQTAPSVDHRELLLLD